LKVKITEKLVSSLWQSRPVRYPVADTGEWLHVIFPGRASNFGGDFKDAVIGVNGRIVSGDIEVHVKSSQWQNHGHHQDTKYNNIVLHVVWQRDSHSATRLQNGRVIPTIALEPLVTRPVTELLKLHGSTPVSCPDNYLEVSALTTLLTRAGLKRFRNKSTAFRRQMSKENAEEVLYRGMARALGYAQNAEPCQELSQRLPAAALKEYGQASWLHRQALLLGHAGLLPSQRDRHIGDRTTTRLERIWRSTGITDTMKSTDWCFFRVRPDNFPTRRLIALSHLLGRLGQSGLLSGILELVAQAPEDRGFRQMEEGLVVADDGYWQKHFDFGSFTGRSSALIGYEKASAMAINIVLPFAAAFARKSSDLELKKKAMEIYRLYPPRGENELTRFMRQQLNLPLNARLSACQQQGLIHLFHTYCRLRNCLDCPVSLSPG